MEGRSQARELPRDGRERRFSVVVPVYNSAETLDDLVRRLDAVFESLGEHEIVLVNDGSPDASWSRIARLASEHENVRGINLMRNFGQHGALLAGIREARHPVIVTIDDDLQNPPEEIPKLVDHFQDHDFDVVYGTAIHPQHGLLRGIATWVTKVTLKSAMGSDIAKQVSPFRVFRTDLRDAFDSFRGPYVSIDVLLSWGTSRFGVVRVRHDPRAEGRSNYNFRRLMTHAMNMATGFSSRPLQLASLIGFCFSLLGLAILVEVVVRRIVEGNPVPGFPFLASIIAIFSGAQLFALGIMGEYLARMHFRVMDKPPYTVRERVGSPTDRADS